jgi:hypothetical protein
LLDNWGATAVVHRRNGAGDDPSPRYHTEELR